MSDPRCNKRNTVDHPLTEMMFLVISAAVSGLNTWTDIQLFGEEKLEWLRKFFPFEKGIPWHGTLGRVFARLDNERFGAYFIEWIESLGQLTKGEVVAIDGKRMRGSYDKSNGKAAVHMVSAYASDQCLCLGQVATEQKSNEITAIPKLLELLTLEGCTVTIDAMGCQRDISKKIIDCKADYILGVKENQKGLLEQIEKVFKITQPCSTHIQYDLGHGREETRKCSVVSNLNFFDDYKDWPGLKTLVKVDSERTIKNTGKKENSTRYYISSKKATAQGFNQNVRSHWAIENKLHWVLDVTFNEDASRKRQGNSATNFALFSKIALALIEKCEEKISRPQKRLRAALSDSFREKILRI